MSPTTKSIAWGVLMVVLAVALTIGATRPSPSLSATQRIAAIDSDLRCPSCEDVSVADSSAPTAIAIRALVTSRVRRGESTSQIENFLESRYGVGILLRPPVGGDTEALWVLPVVLVSISLAVLGGFFWRRHRIAPAQVDEADRALVREALEKAHADV